MGRRTIVVAAAIGVGLGLVVPSAAGAQLPAQDSVEGTALACRQPPTGCESLPPVGTWLRLSADARSGPSGENPAGTMTWDERQVGAFVHSDAEVTCLSVSDDVAIIGVSGTSRFTISVGTLYASIVGFIRITDGDGPAPGMDTIEFDLDLGPLGAPPPPVPGPTDCSAFQAGLPVDTADDDGDLVIADAQPSPTTRDQCKNGGWRKFPGFKNQGQCIRFVRHPAR